MFLCAGPLAVGQSLLYLYLRGRAGQGDLVDLPGGRGHGVLVGRVAPPQALDELGGGLPTPDHVLLPLLLLHLQRQPRAEYALRKQRL